MFNLEALFKRECFYFFITMSKLKYYSKEGLQRLNEELHQLITVARPAASAAIAEARDKGDLSENAEYEAAKEAQGLLEMKIANLQNQISNARLIDESKLDASKVLVFSTVKLKNLKTNAVMTYTLVPENEADLKAGKLSVESPISKGLLGRKQGEKADVQVPAGIIPFEILEITRN
jgi:transcription elongation factor GreA